MKRKSVLIIAGSDSGAGAGIQADIKTFSSFKVYAATVITALTAQNTRGVNAVLKIKSNFIDEQIKVVAEDLDISYIKIGMLSDQETINTVTKSLNLYLPNIPIILDPVMVAKGGHSLLEKKSVNFLKDNLMIKSFLITPNLLEAEKILNCKIRDVDDMIKCEEKFSLLGLHNVVLKGGHLLKSKKVTDFLFNKGKIFKFCSNRINTKNTHGTGCSLASAITANLFLGKSLKESVKISRKFVYKAIKSSYKIGNGHNPINHFVNFKS